MGNSLRVLIVEDSHDDALLEIRELERGGYKPSFERVETAEAFNAAIECKGWDLVLADYALPRFSALEALELLQAHGIELPFIVVSGTRGEETAVDAMKSGAHDFFLKDNLTRLVAAVGHELREAAVRRERKQAEKALREGEKRYHTLFNSGNDAVFVHPIASDGSLGNFTEVNALACERLGYTRQELLRMSPKDIDAPERAEDGRAAAQDLLEHGHALFETVHVARDGAEIPVEINAHVVDWGGQPAVLSLARDITERRRLQQHLQQVSRLKSIGRLAGGVAHDFNNLLTAIKGYAGLLLQGLEADSPAREAAKQISDAADRAADLTRQLLAFSRREPLDPVALDINSVVEGISKMLQRIIGEDIDLDFVPGPELGSVRADRAQIEQVLMNLAVNARDAMPGGGKLVIETANVTLDREYAHRHMGARPGSYVMLAVTDTGCGMDAEMQNRIFEPFFTTKRAHGGTGLGLAIVYSIVKQHGGNIWVYSEPEKGSAFRVYLPRVEAEAAPVEVTPTEAESAVGAETILLVEDEEAVRSIAAHVLQEEGYRVLEARTPSEAEAVFSKHMDEIALLLADVVLPDRNGPALFEKLGAEHRALKVLYISGYMDCSILHGGELSPGTPFLQKPFDPHNLLRKVRDVLDR